MQEQFTDRLLTCVDCHGEFIFTAGEQLFFFDKQFKNDPKRCKPCKSRRSGLSAVANGAGPVAAGLARTETRTQCSDCGIETTVPFKPTQGRPVLCRQCFQLKNRTVAASAAAQPHLTLHTSDAPLSIPADLAAQPLDPRFSRTAEPEPAFLSSLSARAPGLSPDAALLAAASVSAASKQSSIATSADLAYVASLQPAEPIGRTTPLGYPVPPHVQLTHQLMAASAPTDLHTKSASANEAQPSGSDSPQA